MSRPSRLLFRIALCLCSSAALAACLPGDRAKTLIVSNQCSHEVWVRVRESGSAQPEDMATTRGERIAPGRAVAFSVFDNDADGLTLSATAVDGAIGQLLPVPHSDDDRRTFDIRGPSCAEG